MDGERPCIPPATRHENTSWRAQVRRQAQGGTLRTHPVPSCPTKTVLLLVVSAACTDFITSTSSVSLRSVLCNIVIAATSLAWYGPRNGTCV